MPQASNVLGRSHLTLWVGPLHTQRRRHGAPEHLWAQSPEMDHELLLSVTGLFLSNENTIEPAIDLLALVLRKASGEQR